ncbi:type II restriction endonuclease [Lactococcus lactis]|uniref:Type II restriction endonuclease n=1 Tax=Lactococcus lactis TaxID=1358 RepID=A0AAW8UG59_9LACT|nr:type II restriction endonuclease [Lactococcus lactis]MDT2882410.1 type II restriction endonuclease [Lactococcus lactis]MDT2946960.1 type II restriction endonuclease [Lactococcus lactis]
MNEKHFWLLRAFPDNVPHYNVFLNASVVGLGWPRIGKLEKGIKPDELKQLFIENDYPAADNAALGRRAGYFIRFVNEMQIGDIVFVPDNNGIVAVYEIKSDYYYDEKMSVHVPHLRKVQLLTTLKVHSLSKSLQRLLGNQLSFINLDKAKEEITTLISNDSGVGQTTINRTNYSLITGENKGKTVQIIIPNNASNQEITVILNDIIHELEGKL